jgi:hypothetical protein
MKMKMKTTMTMTKTIKMISLRHAWKRRVDIVLPTRRGARKTMSVAVRTARIKSAKRAWAMIDRGRVAGRKDRGRVAGRKVIGSKEHWVNSYIVLYIISKAIAGIPPYTDACVLHSSINLAVIAVAVGRSQRRFAHMLRSQRNRLYRVPVPWGLDELQQKIYVRLHQGKSFLAKLDPSSS